MTLTDLAPLFYDTETVIVFDGRDPFEMEELARYDGRDSVPEELMDKPVTKIFPGTLGADEPYLGVYIDPS